MTYVPSAEEFLTQIAEIGSDIERGKLLGEFLRATSPIPEGVFADADAS
ncbi:hypothetical protein N566_02020 [Streptomycetaceae bacterium MP113-05]|nr:hypothetical protein N566_02020 [Streptomycetaceae bacterium MP113-05]